MVKKIGRILGLAGAGLTLLPNLWFVGGCIYTLCLPDNGWDFESKGYASVFVIVFSIPAVIAIAGLVGSLLWDKRKTLSGGLLIASGTLTLAFGIPPIILFKIGPAMMLAAGIILLTNRQAFQNKVPPDTSGENTD